MKYPELDQATREDLFRRALANGDIDVHYQPFVNTQRQEATGFEALARWETEELGKVSPGEFLSVVETCGLVDEFSEYILEQACRDAVSWQCGANDLRLSVNVSVAQFASDCFATIVRGVLARTGLSAKCLELEVTERVLIADPTVTEERFEALSDLGVSIAIDDFGTGYSSLGALKTAPFDRVKIDRSFVSGLEHDHADQSIVAAIVSLCDAMKLYVIAVGVETPVQEDILSELGCHEVQGFLHARPMSNEEVRPYLLRNNGRESLKLVRTA